MAGSFCRTGARSLSRTAVEEDDPWGTPNRTAVSGSAKNTSASSELSNELIGKLIERNPWGDSVGGVPGVGRLLEGGFSFSPCLGSPFSD